MRHSKQLVQNGQYDDLYQQLKKNGGDIYASQMKELLGKEIMHMDGTDKHFHMIQSSVQTDTNCVSTQIV